MLLLVYKPINIMKGVIYMAQRRDSLESRKRILSACVKLFIENGYTNTTMSEIISEANVSNSTFQNLFHSKSGVLMDLIEFMFTNQFKAANQLAGSGIKPVYIYAVETSIQMTLTELNENLREIYLEAYTFPQSAEYIYQKTSSELYRIFGSYLPEYRESDFYELEIGTAGIMRNYMAKPCDKYFTLEKKLERFLTMSLSAFSVPKEEQKEVLDYMLSINIRSTANAVMQALFHELAMKFDFELDENENINKMEVLA